MSALWEVRMRKLDWARNNPDKVREANRLWRISNPRKAREQARARMARYRKRLRVTKELSRSGDDGGVTL